LPSDGEGAGPQVYRQAATRQEGLLIVATMAYLFVQIKFLAQSD
jgi:hypothetical protein